jgi:hypothetical protein
MGDADSAHAFRVRAHNRLAALDGYGLHKRFILGFG